MVEKRQERSEASPALMSAGDEERRVDALLDTLPDGVSPLPTIHDDLSSELLEIAERQVAETRRKLGSQTSKPRLKRIEELFAAKAGRAPKPGEEISRLMRAPSTVQQTAALDRTFDHAVATALNLYDQSSVQGGAIVQAAHDNWNMAVRLYKSELRSAGALMAAGIDIANQPSGLPEYEDYDNAVRGSALMQHYGRAAKIGQSILDYEKAMQVANAALAIAYGKLTSALFDAVNALAVAEATLISATQTAYAQFWAGIQNAVGQART